MLHNPFRILIADDDVDDIQLAKDCFVQNRLPIAVKEVADGQFLLEHLRKSVYDDGSLLPQLIIVDINMPRKTGLEALKEIKADANLKQIPVVVFSTSRAQHDIDTAYDLGASCFLVKPNTLEEWNDKLGKLGKFWTDCVKVAVK